MIEISRDEHKQFELKTRWGNVQNLRFLIGDVRDRDRLTRAMEGIDIAAMKHVEACEYNPFEAVQTNIIGTQNVILAANQMKVEKVVFTVEVIQIGLRPGEKLYEELMTFEESKSAIELPNMFIIPSPYIQTWVMKLRNSNFSFTQF